MKLLSALVFVGFLIGAVAITRYYTGNSQAYLIPNKTNEQFRHEREESGLAKKLGITRQVSSMKAGEGGFIDRYHVTVVSDPSSKRMHYYVTKQAFVFPEETGSYDLPVRRDEKGGLVIYVTYLHSSPFDDDSVQINSDLQESAESSPVNWAPIMAAIDNLKVGQQGYISADDIGVRHGSYYIRPFLYTDSSAHGDTNLLLMRTEEGLKVVTSAEQVKKFSPLERSDDLYAYQSVRVEIK